MSTNRGMSVSEARALAKNPKTSIGILTRLANGYPEVWDDLLANPALTPDLRSWIEKSISQNEADTERRLGETKNPSVAIGNPKSTSSPKPAKLRSRGRRRFGRLVHAIGALIIPGLMIFGLYQLVDYLNNNKPIFGGLVQQELSVIDDNPAWKYDLSTTADPDCVQYQIGTADQGKVAVLVQNDLSKKECKDREDVPSSLALVNLKTGKADWKIDLAAELDWTPSWKKQLIEVPGLNEILVKYIDVNGSDVSGDTKVIDSKFDRKMKTLVPYNRLNGRIPDPVIVKSKSQPIMQAPVLEVLAIPGNLKSVLVMTNGAKKDFRYAKYRSKRINSPRWSVESDLRPMGGNPVIGTKLVLGRDKEDQPAAVNLNSGKLVSWAGSPAVKLYHIGSQLVQITGDGVSDKATNATSQGGVKGHKIQIDGIDLKGNVLWTMKAKGFAIAADDSSTNPKNRNWMTQLFILDGKYNQYVSLVDASTGKSLWRTKISQMRFEISRITAGNRIAIYLYKKVSTDTKSFSVLNLVDGSESKPMKIASKTVRVDGATNGYSILTDEPDRTKIIRESESGRVASLNRTDKSDTIRNCIIALNNETSKIAWEHECNGNLHALRAGGSWLMLDLSRGSESFWPLKAGK